VKTRLEADDTRALSQEIPKVLRTEINDILLTALAQAVGGGPVRRDCWRTSKDTAEKRCLDDVDVSRTVGWFTSVYPVLLDTSGTRDGWSLLKIVKERQRAIPRRGAGYGLLRYLRDIDDIAEQLRRLPSAQDSV
jgi:hypothetical protein